MQYITLMSMYVAFTLVWLLVSFNKRKREHCLLLAILVLSVVNEIVSLVLRANDLPIRLNTTIYVIANIYFWLALFYHVSRRRRTVLVAVALFTSFMIFNFVLLDGMHRFNSYTFVVGALLYVMLFIYDSAIELRKENLNYFLSNKYLLIASPVLFFISFSFLFGFRTIELRDIIIYDSITLFDFVSYFANIVYYTLINFYIYFEKKLHESE